jgi:hypothetical protein
MKTRGAPPAAKAHPEYVAAFTRIMSGIERALGAKRPSRPVDVCVAGGAALHFYTGARISNDIDAKIMARVLLDPDDLQVAYKDADGHARILYFDTHYNDSFALLHEDAYEEAIPLELEGLDARRIRVTLLSPLDLAVSKVGRFSAQDREDIRELGRAGLVDSAALRRRATDALANYVGDPQRIKASIDTAAKDLEKIPAYKGRQTKPSPER